MSGSRQLAAAARDLKDRYGDLLCQDPSFRERAKDEVVDALGAAQRRVVAAGARDPSAQMSIEDLRG